jgi:DNA-binding NtrC family response regulator
MPEFNPWHLIYLRTNGYTDAGKTQCRGVKKIRAVMIVNKNVAILIDRDSTKLEQLRSAIKERDPGIHCISFQFADEAIFVMQSELICSPQYIFLDLDESTGRLTDCLNLFPPQESDTTRVIVFSTVLPKILAETYTHQGVYRAFQKPITKTDYRQAVAMSLAKSGNH